MKKFLIALLAGALIGRVLLPALFESSEQAARAGARLRSVVIGDH